MLAVFQRAPRSLLKLIWGSVFLLSGLSPLPGNPLWVKVSTSHFEMYTGENETTALQALHTFEDVRSFFLHNSKSNSAPEEPVRIFAFSSEGDYRPYRLNEGAFAYYVRSRERDYIVMQDIHPEHYHAAIHEYTHLVIEHAHMRLPLWLNEGLAEFFSSLEPHGQQTMVGRPLPERLWTLHNQGWMSWKLLFTVDRSSPYYNKADKMQMFYSQSWALTHMLELDDRYRVAFPGFLAKIANGMPTADALQSSFGKTVKQVDDDLRAYLEQYTLRARLFDFPLQKSDLQPEVMALTDLQVKVALATLLATSRPNTKEARDRLIALETANSGNPAIEESLGYLAWRENRLADAQQYFNRAIQSNSNDAQMIYQFAVLRKSAGASPQEVIRLLDRALALKPGLREALLLLGFTSVESRQFDSALSALRKIKTIEPDGAYDYFAALAFCYGNLIQPAAAKQHAERALNYAKNPTEKRQMEDLLRRMDK